jgi:hypothetical protein
VIGVLGPQPAVDLVDLVLEVVDQLDACADVGAPRLGDVELRKQPSTPNRSVTGQGRPKLISVEWIRHLSADLWRTRCMRKRANSRRSLTLGSGSQIAGTRSRWESVANTNESVLSVLQAGGANPLTFWASAISTSQPQASSVSWTIRAPGHRLDHGADGLSVNLVDPPGQRSQGVDVGWRDELIEMLTLLGEQADVDLSPTQV